MREHGAAGLEHAGHRPRLGEPGEVARIAVEHDGIEDVALLEAPELVLDAAELGSARGRHEQRLLDRSARPGA